jgi:hypothetical protein
MTHKTARLALAAVIALAACDRAAPGSMDDAMRRDLEAVQAGTIEMAPAGDGQKVVSAIEQTRRAQPQPRTPAPRAPDVAREVAQNAEPEPAPDPVSTAPAPTSTEPVATRPSSAPRVSPPPPGGYKTVGEVIRNAPFPIKPATTVKPPR